MLEIERHKDELISLLEPFENTDVTSKYSRKVIDIIYHFCKSHDIEMNLDVTMYFNLLLFFWQWHPIKDYWEDGEKLPL